MASKGKKKAKVDIEGLVMDWAKDYFVKKATTRKLKKLLAKDYINIDIDWKRVDIEQGTPEYDPAPPKPGDGLKCNNVLFHTTFDNKSDLAQTHTFQCERSTRTSCTVEVEQTVTKGMDCSFKLAAPEELFEANVGFQREFSVTEVHGQTLEEEISWGVNSEINVEGKHRAEAKLTIVEEEYNGKFTITTKMKGPVKVTFANIKDNNSFIMAAEKHIDQIVSDAIRSEVISGNILTVDGSTNTVVFKTVGQAKFRYGVKQHVEVDQKKVF